MDKLFKFLGKNKKEVVKVEEKEQEKKPENLDVIGNIRWYGLPYIRKAFFYIGLAGASYGQREAIEYFHRPQELRNRQEVLDDYKDILGPEEYKEFLKFTEINETQYISQDYCQKNIKKITDNFPITSSELITLDDLAIQRNIDTLANDLDLQKTLSEIKSVEKEGFDMGFSMIPVQDIALLRNRVYVENMKSIVSLGIETNSNPEQLSVDQYNELSKLSKEGNNITFDYSALSYKGPKASLDSFPHVKENFDNNNIGYMFLSDLANKDQRSLFKKWDTFLANPENKAIFSILQHEGYAFSSFAYIPQQINSIDSFLKNQGTMEFLLRLADNVKSEDLATMDVARILGFVRDNYSHGTYDSLSKIIPDLRIASGGEKISLKHLMTNLQEIGIYQNIYLPLISETPKADRLQSNFFYDPALTIVRELGYHKHPPKILAAMNLRDQASWIMQTCRLMHVTGAKHSEEIFNTTLQSIMETRSNPEILSKELFRGRDVAIMAHNQLQADYQKQEQDSGSTEFRVRRVESPRFGKEALVDGIKKQNPKSMEYFKVSQDLHDLKEKKQKTLHFIQTSKKLTLFIDAHGSEWAVSFSEGLPENGEVTGQDDRNAISFSEISDALIKRFESGIKDRAIIIDDACMNFRFLQNIYFEIENYNNNHDKNVPLPITVGMSEIGQYGFSEIASPYGSIFSEDLLEGSAEKTLTIKDVLEIESSGGMYSNLSVFIPQTIEKNIWVFVGNDKVSTSEKSDSKKSPKNATQATTSGKYRMVDGDKFEKKKIKMEVPYQIAENEKNSSEEQDIPTT